MDRISKPDTLSLIPAEVWLDLVEVGKSLTSASELNEVLNLIMEKLQARIQATNWSLMLTDPATGALKFHIFKGVDADGVSDLKLEPGEGVAGAVFATGEPLFVADTAVEPRFCSRVDKVTGFQTRSIVALPLKVENEVLGVIELVNLADFEGFIESKVPLLQIMVDYAAIAIHHARTIEKLKRQTITDSLTGLYNDRFLYAFLDKELEEAVRSGATVCVTFLDLDDFKQVVDTYGHLVGSRMLKLFGGFLREQLAPVLPIVRFGGDEFVILMTGMDKAEARAVVEKLMTQLRKKVFEPGDGIRVTISASFGIASFPADATDLKGLLSHADEAMYRVKRAGKNAVES